MDPEGQMDFQQLLAAAQQMQNELLNAQQELTVATVEGTAGGGLVTARLNGQGSLVDLTISARAIDPGDPEETAQSIAALVLAAVRDAYRAVEELQQEKMGPFAALGGPGQQGPGEGMPNISELFGGAIGGGAPGGGGNPAEEGPTGGIGPSGPGGGLGGSDPGSGAGGSGPGDGGAPGQPGR